MLLLGGYFQTNPSLPSHHQPWDELRLKKTTAHSQPFCWEIALKPSWRNGCLSLSSGHHFLLSTSPQHAPCVTFLSLHTDASTVFRKHLTTFEQRGIKQGSVVPWYSWREGSGDIPPPPWLWWPQGTLQDGKYWQVSSWGILPQTLQSRRIGFVGFRQMYSYLFTFGSLCYEWVF